MYAYGSALQSVRARKLQAPSEELRIGITFRRPGGEPGPTKFAAPLSTTTVRRFLPDPLEMDQAIYELSKRGFTLTRRGHLTASMRCSRQVYEQTFATQLSTFQLDPKAQYAFHSFYFPQQGAPWKPAETLADLIDDAYIQWPHIYMAAKRRSPGRTAGATKLTKRPRVMTRSTSARSPSANPPHVDYYHLEMPLDVLAVLNVTQVHRAGTTGKGVRVVMVDSGFAHGSHPFFAAQGFQSTVDLAPHAVNDQTDLNGHGTGESTNIFAVAPGATFIGVKTDNDDDARRGASLLEGFQTALQHQPHIISISMGYDLLDDTTFRQLSELANSLAAL